MADGKVIPLELTEQRKQWNTTLVLRERSVEQTAQVQQDLKRLYYGGFTPRPSRI
jgi:hypothetical protein